MYYEQQEYDVRCEWGLHGVTFLAPQSDVVVIVDVLSFSTSIDIAVSRGAIIYPYGGGEGVEEFAAAKAAQVASRHRSVASYSLSPGSLMGIEPDTRIVLPSPNGSTLSIAAGEKPTLAGCLRNAGAVASAAQRMGKKILVVPAGERWPDNSLRPALEDLLGAGSIIRHLRGSKSPEASAAEAAFLASAGNLINALKGSSSGKELMERGFTADVELAAHLNVSHTAPSLVGGAYRMVSG